jgi:hypothetical protein
MSSIRLSEKHGVNPSMDTCFYCGEVTGIALMGKISNKDNPDVEAPRYCCSSVKPCDKCAEKYKDYVLMVEAKSSDSKNPQPTGRWFVLKKEVLNPAYRNSPVAFMLEQDFNQVLNDFNKEEK